MSVARLGFGCAVDQYGERIYAVGGSIENLNPTKICEYYSVSENTWNAMPSIPEAKLSQSLCVFSDTWLYQFGGFNGNGKAPS